MDINTIIIIDNNTRNSDRQTKWKNFIADHPDYLTSFIYDITFDDPAAEFLDEERPFLGYRNPAVFLSHKKVTLLSGRRPHYNNHYNNILLEISGGSIYKVSQLKKLIAYPRREPKPKPLLKEDTESQAALLAEWDSFVESLTVDHENRRAKELKDSLDDDYRFDFDYWNPWIIEPR